MAVIHIKYKYMCRRRDRMIEKLNIVEMKKLHIHGGVMLDKNE